MTHLLKDPLLHFLLIGVALFAVSSWRGGDPDPDRIVIPAVQVERLGAAAERASGRPPTREELAEILEPTIRDEVYYREALALGLDVDDDEVRRRLIEKMQYLTENLADPEPPSEPALREYYDSQPDRFAIPETVTFEQVFFSPRLRGETAGSDAEDALAALSGGADPGGLGDPTPLGVRFDAATRERVEVLFGEPLTAAVFSMEPGSWAGPFRSDFGLHVVRLVERTPGRLPTFDEVREQVARTYAADARAERNAAAYAEMRSRYDVVVEWPAAGNGS